MYSLQTILGWDDSVYKPLRKKVNVDISNFLDHALSASNQPAGLVKKVTKVVSPFIHHASPSSNTL